MEHDDFVFVFVVVDDDVVAAVVVVDDADYYDYDSSLVRSFFSSLKFIHIRIH